ncbi:hypothetical protein KKF84_01725 [Myxococcota bacterium]|nr:hypothetical protein [Myxococcota bacterium]MBU1534005.1 hypothetical protein [Myxococcota bacterium]
MVDFNINEWMHFWNQEKFQLEQEIISLSSIRDRLWSQKEFYKEKSLLLKERLTREHTVPVQPVPSVNGSTSRIKEIEGVRSRISGTKKFIGLLADKLHELSASLDTEMAPYLIDREKELEKKLQETTASLALVKEQKEALEEEFRSHKKVAYSRQEETLSQDSRLEMQLLSTRDEMGKLLEKEDRYILEIRKLEVLNASLVQEQEEINNKEAQISNLKYLLDQGARDYERLQEKMERLLHENHKFRQSTLDMELDRVKLKTKVVGLEKVLKTRDINHGKELASLVVQKRESDTRADNLEEETQRLSSHLANVNDEMEETRGRFDATVYELSVLKREMESMVSAQEVDALGDTNGTLLAEIEELHETIGLLEQNIEALEARIATSVEVEKPVDHSEIHSEVSSIRSLIEDAFTQEQIRQAIPLSAGDAHFVSEEDLRQKALIENLKTELLESDSLRQRLELTLALNEDERKNLEDKLVRLEEDLLEALSMAQAAHDHPSSEEATLKSRITELEAEITRMETVASKNSEALMSEKSRCASIDNQLQILGSENSRLHHFVTTLSQSKPALFEHLDNLESTVDQLEDSLLLEEDRAHASGREIESLGGSIASILDTMEQKIHEKDYEILTLHTEIQSLKTGLPQSSHESPSDSSETQKTISKQQQIIEDLTTQLGNLETELLIAQATNPDSQDIKNDLAQIANNLEMMGLMQASSDLRTILEKI